MQEQTIKRNIYILLGATVFILIAIVAAWGLALNRPLLENIAKQKQQYESRKSVADQLPQALRDEVKAEQQKVYVQSQLAFFQQRYRHLVFDYGSDKDPKDVQEAKKIDTWERWQNEYFADYGLSLKNELLNAASASGVSINTSIKVSPPPKVPEELPPTPPGFLKPIADNNGSLNVDVVGSYPSLLDFFNRINTSSILMVVGTVKIAAVTPSRPGFQTLKASFPITPYLLQTGPAVKTSGSSAPPPAPVTPSVPRAAPSTPTTTSDDSGSSSNKPLGLRNRGGGDAEQP